MKLSLKYQCRQAPAKKKGLTLIMKWIKYDVHTTTKDADIVGEILIECGIYGFEISDHVPLSREEEKKMYTDIPAELGEDDGSSILTFYTESPDNTARDFFSTGSSLRDGELSREPIPKPDELVAKILATVKEKQAFIPITSPKIHYCEQDDSLWKDKWKENFKPFHAADDIIIKPTWWDTPNDAKPDDIIVQIDPGSAFGTGTHETTKLCLLALRKYITPETKILDAGCGSGILAITALLCGAKSAFCLDIDPAAVKGTIENAQNNRLDDSRITAVHANILEDSDTIYKNCEPPYHIVVANILADVVIPLTEHIGKFLRDDGLYISSGILSEKAADVELALKKNHFHIIEKNTLGEWVSFVCKK